MSRRLPSYSGASRDPDRHSYSWNAQSFPFLSQQLFFVNGSVFDQSLILTPDYKLNETALHIYGLPWYSASNAFYYLGCNLAIGATYTHIGLWYWRPVVQAVKNFRTRTEPDPHYQKMLVYRCVLPGHRFSLRR